MSLFRFGFWLSDVYNFYLRTVLRRRPSDEVNVAKYFEKTLKYVHKSTDIEEIEKDLPVIEFDANYLKNLELRAKTKEEMAVDMVFTLNRFILTDKQKNPVSESLVEKVEQILELWNEKTKDFDEIYRQSKQVIDEYEERTARQKQLGLDALQYSLLLRLEDQYGQDERLVEDVNDFSNQLHSYVFKDWHYQTSAKKQVERETRRFIRSLMLRYEGTINKSKLDELQRMVVDSIISHGKEL
jgi:type I restriction enzyme R subunit